ncbi:MAG: glutathione transferase GstA [Enterobacteriaceae bacterium]
MKLYYKPGACSLSPHIILREAGIDFSLEQVDLAAKTTEHGADFLKINPKGQVPALLLDDGSLLTEGVVIVQYLADQVPDRKLIPPAGSMARYHVLEWLNFIATELHKSFGPLFTPNTPEEYKSLTFNRLQQKLQSLESVLAKHSYLTGEQFTVADAYLFTVLRWAYWFKFDFSNSPATNAYLARVAARPAVAAALQAEKIPANPAG